MDEVKKDIAREHSKLKLACTLCEVFVLFFLGYKIMPLLIIESGTESKGSLILIAIVNVVLAVITYIMAKIIVKLSTQLKDLHEAVCQFEEERMRNVSDLISNLESASFLIEEQKDKEASSKNLN